MKKLMKQQIGIATIVTDAEGAVIEAMFDPIMKIKDCTDLVAQLKGMSTVSEQAQLVFGAWFSKLADVELADREKYVVRMYNIGKINMPTEDAKTRLPRYPEGSVGERLLFQFEERESELAEV